MNRSPSTAYGPTLAAESGQRIDRIIARWAADRPDAPAVLHPAGTTSYRQLVDRAAVYQEVLRQAGVGSGEVVAVELPRGPELIEVLLAVLQLGAVYLALDQEWPKARREQAVRQAGARYLLREGSLSVLPDGGSPLAPGADPCAVFFTSGTTGVPKAALSTHAGLIRIARDPLLALGPDTRMLQTAPVPWDAFSLEVWGPLVAGGSTLLHQGRLPTPADVRRAVSGGVNTLFITAALFHACVGEDPGVFAGLRLLMTGGERVSPRQMADCRAANPGLRLLDVYGPVEATVFATAHELPAAVDSSREIPIGRPLAETSVHVLDGDHRVVARGTEGQIAIGGAGLALCYLGDDERSSTQFPVLPIGPGGSPVRVYLTGDRGRMSAEGELEFLGRADRQLKIRGVRVDPAETERCLTAHPAVAQASVLAIEDGPGLRLEAFCVLSGPGTVTAEQLLAAVALELPTAYQPHRVHLLDALPLTATGKIDSPSLVARAMALPQRADSAPDQPLDALTGAVLAHTAELLGTAPGADDDLFRYGATSITAIRLSARVARDTGVTLSAGSIMRARTSARIADLVRAAAEPATAPARSLAASSPSPSR